MPWPPACRPQTTCLVTTAWTAGRLWAWRLCLPTAAASAGPPPLCPWTLCAIRCVLLRAGPLVSCMQRPCRPSLHACRPLLTGPASQPCARFLRHPAPPSFSCGGVGRCAQLNNIHLPTSPDRAPSKATPPAACSPTPKRVCMEQDSQQRPYPHPLCDALDAAHSCGSPWSSLSPQGSLPYSQTGTPCRPCIPTPPDLLHSQQQPLQHQLAQAPHERPGQPSTSQTSGMSLDLPVRAACVPAVLRWQPWHSKWYPLRYIFSV